MIDSCKLHVDPTDDSIELVIDLVGETPFQHEFIKEVLRDEMSVSGQEASRIHGKMIGPEDIRLRIPIRNKGAFERAKHTIENKRRADSGLPSLEQEEKMREARDAEPVPEPKIDLGISGIPFEQKPTVPQFKVGQVVHLKDGSPDLTIIEMDDVFADVEWPGENGEVLSGSYRLENLV